MSYDPKRHHRRSIRMKGYDYSQPGAYFITLVVQGRECLFGEIVDGEMHLSDMGLIADEHWRAIPDHFPQVRLGASAIMPNHLHGIIIIQPEGVRADAPPTTVRATHWVAPTDAPTETPTDAPTTTVRATHWVAPTNGPKRGSIGAIISAYKMSVTRRIQRELNRNSPWQRNYYEHIIRNEEEHQRIHLYIEANPINWLKDANHPGKRK